MQTVLSKDGTQIAYDKQGEGPAIILIDGALCYRSFGPMGELSKRLAPHFTVYTYDRRGRGDSQDTPPYAIEREVEDLQALIQAAGGAAYLFGMSSGGALALEAALRLGDKVKKLAIYEAPYNDDQDSQPEWKAYSRQLSQLIAADRRGDAAALFMTFVGTPEEMLNGMRQAPVWSMFEAVAPTLAYDAAVMGEDQSVPKERIANLDTPTLVMNGGAGFPFMYDSARKLANRIPHAQLRTLEGQTHEVNPDVLAPVLIEFFKG